MDDFLREMPKAELHLHLEGSVEPETLHELDPATSVDDYRSLYRYSDFDAFLKAFGAVGKRLRTPEDYALITRRLLDRLASQNVRYAEIIVAAGVVLWKQQDFASIFDAIHATAQNSPVKVRWILDAVRQFGVEPARRVAEWAAERQDRGVVAFGIGGSEERGPADWFGDVFAFAKSAGLHLTAHAGESIGPESVWAALKLGVERIGHGIRSIEDPALVAHLRERQIPLEICITSNLVTGVVRRLEDHPVRRLFDAGVPITLNTDDPAMFGCTLVGEYELAARSFGFSEPELQAIAENSLRYRFGALPAADFKIETERLILTTWNPEDLEAFRPIATDPEVMRYISGGASWPEERIRLFVQRQIEIYRAYGHCRWKLIDKASGEMAGFCGPGWYKANRYPEIGWWLARRFWGRGLASEAAVAALRDAFERVGLERVISVAMVENRASQRIMEKVGLEFETEFESEGFRLVRYAINRGRYQRLADARRSTIA